MIRVSLFFFILFLLSGCNNSEEAINALQASGYRDITITGYKYFGCDRNDLFRIGFNAVGPTGIPASGVVCSGPLKGATIRLF